MKLETNAMGWIVVVLKFIWESAITISEALIDIFNIPMSTNGFAAIIIIAALVALLSQ